MDNTETKLAELQTDVRWIKATIQDGHACIQDERVKSVEKRLDTGRIWLVALVTCFLGVGVSVVTTCQSQGEQVASTRVMVESNTKNINKLEKAVRDSNDARESDVSQIVRELRKVKNRRSVNEWCETLNRSEKRVLGRLRRNPCGS